MIKAARRWLARKLDPDARGIHPKASHSSGFGRSYDGARHLSTNPFWNPPHTSGDSAIRDSWSMVTSRMRNSIRNNPTMKKLRDQWVTLAVGSGIGAYAEARNDDRTLIWDYNRQNNFWWKEWGSRMECDFIGEQTFNGMVRTAFQDVVEVGNAFFIETQNTDNDICPLAYQLIEWEQVARERDRPGVTGVNMIENGIEYDAGGRKVALWIYKSHPYSSLNPTWEVDRIPWSRVIHLYLPNRISSKSGISWFTSCMLTAHNTGIYIANELESSKVAAAVTLLLKVHDAKNANSVGSGTLDCEPASHGGADPHIEFGQSVTAKVEPDEDAKILDSPRPNAAAGDFMHAMDKEGARGAGLSVQRLNGDASDSTFASIKAAFEDDSNAVAPYQEFLIDHAILPIRRRWNQMAVATRRINQVSVTQYQNSRYKWDVTMAIPPRQASAEPLKEVEASKARLGAGMSSYQREAAKDGNYFYDLVDEISEANAYCEEKEVALDVSKGQGGQLAQNSTQRMEPQEVQGAQAPSNQTSR